MKKTLFYGALIGPLGEETAPVFLKGDLLVEGDRIAALACHPERLASDAVTKVVDARHLIIMPGLVNTHGHAAMSLLRSYADDLPLKEWLEQKIWPVEDRLTSEDVYWGTMLSIVEMLKSGTTTFADMYFFMDQVAEAVAESGIRAVLSRGLMDAAGAGAKALREAEELYRRWHGGENGRLTFTLGPHAIYTCTTDYLRKVMAVAERTGQQLQIHLSETAGEVENCYTQHGCSPVELLEKIGFLNYPVIAAHCVHLSDVDISILAEHGVGVAHNPGSNLKLGSGIAPLARLLAAGVKVGLGTDGPSSNNNLDMIEEMRLASLLAKGTAQDPTLVSAATALQLATAGGAAVLSLEGVGRLEPGYKADLIGINYDQPHFYPLHDPLANLVYAARSADVEFVMVDGQFCVENGALTRLDEEKIKAEASRCARRLTGKGKIRE